VSQKSLDESPGARILFQESLVLDAKLVTLIRFDSDLAFKLSNVFYTMLAEFSIEELGH
jgi:hypothetical protein